MNTDNDNDSDDAPRQTTCAAKANMFEQKSPTSPLGCKSLTTVRGKGLGPALKGKPGQQSSPGHESRARASWDEAQDYFLCSLAAHLRVITLDLNALADKPDELAQLVIAAGQAMDVVQAELKRRSGLPEGGS